MNDAEDTNGLSLLVRYQRSRPYLIGGKCGTCHAVSFPKKSICSRCNGGEIQEILLSRRGKLVTYTEVHHKPPDYEGDVPYYIGRVLLPEGVFILAQLSKGREDLRSDMDMELVVEPIYTREKGELIRGYKFRPIA